jgi:hypothetical protein
MATPSKVGIAINKRLIRAAGDTVSWSASNDYRRNERDPLRCA